MTEISPQSGSESFERCEQCHAPVDAAQRYCVSCGTHRRGVPDPSAAYLAQHTARSATHGRASDSGAATGNRRAGSGELGLLGALALALIPVAAAVGIAIGRSSNNQDGKLISALERQHAQVTTTLQTSSTGAQSGGSSTSTTSTAGAKRAKRSASKSRTHSKRATVSATTPHTKVTKVSGAKVTASQQTQGSSEAKKVQSSTGKSYVQADNNLPSSVVVGP